MKNDRVYLHHIRDAIQRIEKYTSAGRDQFYIGPMIQDAVIRNLEVIGEAVSKGCRNIYATPTLIFRGNESLAYAMCSFIKIFGVKLDSVWQVVARHLPPLRDRVTQLRARMT